jgi:hypothetical protein
MVVYSIATAALASDAVDVTAVDLLLTFGFSQGVGFRAND